MPDPNNQSMMRIEDLVWPMSARYHLRTSFGMTSHELHWDVPMLNGDLVKSRALVPRIWSAAIATAITRSTRLDWYEYIIWKEAPLPQIGAAFSAQGLRFGTPADRDKCGVLLLETGHRDDYGTRRLFASGMPNDWQAEGLLTDRGWDGMMQWAHTLAMGLSSYFSGGEIQLLLAYPHFWPASVTNLTGVQFRLVSDFRVCQYTDKAPEEGPSIWP